MVQTRLSMRKNREVLRLAHEQGRSGRQIAQSIGLTQSTVGRYLRRAERAGLAWPLPVELDDRALEARPFPLAPSPGTSRPVPEWRRIYKELSSHKSVTLQLLWLEYREAHPDGYSYSRFSELHRA